MHMGHIAKSFALIVTLAASAGAQRTVAPGDPALLANRVGIGIDTIVLLRTPRDSAEVVAAILYRRIERITQATQSLIRETQRYEAHIGARTIISYDTLDVDAVTLLAVRSFSTDGKTSVDVRFAGLTMDGVVTTPDSGARPLHVALPGAAFPSIMQEGFVAALPFGEVGSFIRMPMLYPPAATVRHSVLTVAQSDTVRTARGLVPARLITTANGAIQFWVAVDDGRMIRMHWTLPDGSSIWKLTKREADFRDAARR